MPKSTVIGTPDIDIVTIKLVIGTNKHYILYNVFLIFIL